jgi:hypothetical protein
MLKAIEELVATFERGRSSRRDLILSLSALALAPRSARAQRAPLKARTLDHVSIMVSDVGRSARSYPVRRT